MWYLKHLWFTSCFSFTHGKKRKLGRILPLLVSYSDKMVLGKTVRTPCAIALYSIVLSIRVHRAIFLKAGP